MKLKRLFIVSTCLCDASGRLAPEGLQSAEHIGMHIAEKYGLARREIAVINSAHVDAVRTAEQIVRVTGAEESQPFRELFSCDGLCDVFAALRVIAGYEDLVENLVVVTHQTMAMFLPVAFGRERLRGGRNFNVKPYSDGQGCCILTESVKCEDLAA